MNKICTSIEQSQKLKELGIDIDTADMRYKLEQWIDDDDCPLQPITYPCWSLSSLIDILPDTITDEDGTVFGLNIKKNFIEYYNPSMGALWATYCSIIAEDLVDACYEMILKLNELKLL